MFLTGGYLFVETNKLLIESNAIAQLRDSSNQKLCRRHFITIHTAIRRLEACTRRSLAKRTIFCKLRRVISIRIKRSIHSSHRIIRYRVVWHHWCLFCVLYHLIYTSGSSNAITKIGRKVAIPIIRGGMGFLRNIHRRMIRLIIRYSTDHSPITIPRHRVGNHMQKLAVFALADSSQEIPADLHVLLPVIRTVQSYGFRRVPRAAVCLRSISHMHEFAAVASRALSAAEVATSVGQLLGRRTGFLGGQVFCVCGVVQLGLCRTSGVVSRGKWRNVAMQRLGGVTSVQREAAGGGGGSLVARRGVRCAWEGGTGIETEVGGLSLWKVGRWGSDEG